MRGVYGFALVLRVGYLFTTTTSSDVRSSYSFLDYPHISWIDFDCIGNHRFNTNKINNK